MGDKSTHMRILKLLFLLSAILCIAQSTSPSIVGQVIDTTNLNGAAALAVSGNYAYVTANIAGALNVIDVTNPASPSIVGQVIDGTNLDGAFGVAVSGDYAYVAAINSDALTVTDVTNPASPSVAGQVIDTTNLYGASGVLSPETMRMWL